MNKKLLIGIFLCAALFRILLIPIARHGDLNNNSSWGSELLIHGPVGFYGRETWPFSAPNQPPLYLILFAGASSIHSAVSSAVEYLNQNVGAFPSSFVWWWEWWGELYVMKIPGILADLGIAYVIYLFVRKRSGVILAALWLINPISWYNSAIWGGTDSIVNLFGLLSFYYLIEKKYLAHSASFFLVSILFKGSLLMFAQFGYY